MANGARSEDSEIAFLVVGLGNPGAEYEDTPHNLGFKVADYLGAANRIRITRKESQAFVGLGQIAGKPVAIAKPQTFMNLSGVAARALIERYGLKAAQVIAVYDELALPWGDLRVRPRGSDAGHNGVKSLIGSLGTNEFPRVRVGIHPEGRPVGDGAKYVLAPFKRGQQKEVEEMVARAAGAVETIIAEGVEKSMTAYNRRAGSLNTEE